MDRQENPTQQYTFSAGQALQLADLLRRWGIHSQQLLGPFGLDEAGLSKPRARVSLETMIGLTDRARALTGEPGLGFYMGLHKQVSTYGLVGFAAMSASTMREALEQAVEFSPLLSNTISLALSVHGETAALSVTEHVDLGSVHDVALFSFFVGLSRMTADLTGRESKARAELNIPKPDYYDRFAHLLPGARFDQPVAQLVFRADGLDVPLLRDNRAALNLARQHCQEQLAELGFGSSLVGQVRQAITRGGEFHSADQVASALGMSRRTLKRRLSEQGVSFSQLLRDERQLRAVHLLRDRALSLDEVAARLGYSQSSNFCRAFLRWTGKTPAAYRRSLRAQPIPS